MTQLPVAIAGAGPVGMVAGLALARQGVPVVVFEAGERLSSESRASTFHPPTLELLHELDVAEELISIGIVAPALQFRDRREGLIARFDLGLLARDTRYPYRLQCEQSKLTEIVLERLRDYPSAEVRFASEVVGVQLAADGVVVVVATPGGEERVPASYLVGADGASSRVRKSLGIDFPGKTYPERYLVISTTFEFADAFDDLDAVNYVLDPSEWLTLLRTPEHWRAMFPVGMDENDDELVDLDRVQARLMNVWRAAEPYPVLHRTIYRVHQRVAGTYRRGRALLAGDAAHINNPLGGLGMNSGIHDAWVAGAALARQWHGRGSDRELEDYARTRREVSTAFVARESDRNWRRLRETDPEARGRELDELRRTASDPALAREYLLQACMFGSAPDVSLSVSRQVV